MLGFRLEVQALSRRNLLWSAVLTGGLAVGLKALGVFQGADLALWDFWLRSRPQEARSTSVVVVEITEQEIQDFGSWPLPESTLAAAISQIETDKPRAIGLISPASLSATSSRWISSEAPTKPPPDLTASSETRINDPAPLAVSPTVSPAVPSEVPPEARSSSASPALTPLATETRNPLFTELLRIPHLIVGFEDLSGDKVSPRIPPPQLGAIDVVLDSDGKLRRNLLSIRTGERFPQASLALRLSLLYLRHEGIEPHPLDSDRGWFQFGERRIVPLSSSGGGYVQAQQQGYHIPLIYQTPLRNFPRVTLSQVLEGQVNPDVFRDRVVIIGTVAPRFSYAVETPLVDARNDDGNDADPRHTVPDLWIQAQATQQLLSIALEGRGITTTIPDGLEALGILLWTGGGTFLCASLGRAWKQRQDLPNPWHVVLGVAFGVTVSGSLVTVGLGLGLLSIGIWLPIAGMLGGLYAAIFGVSLLEVRRIHEQQNDLALILDTTLQHAESIEGQFLRDRDRYHVESNLRSQQLLDAMPVGVTLFNVRGELEYANDRARALLGEQVLSQPINVKDFATVCSLYDPNTEQPCADDRLPVTLALKGKESYVRRLEIRTPLSSGSEANLDNSTVSNSDLNNSTVDKPSTTAEQFIQAPSVGAACALDASTTRIPIEGWGQPIFNLKGVIQYAIFAFQDTLSQEEAWNERLRLTADLEAKNQALQEANRLKDEFLKRTTHELRTPLNGIIGSLQIVLDDLCDDKFEERELLDQAHQSALHLFDIVNDILDFSRIKSGHVVLNLRSVDLHACLTQSLYLQLSNLRQKKLKLIKKYNDESITVLADPIRLKQVLINTIGNAVKFTDEGNIAIYTSIETQTKPSGDVQVYGIVEIHDTGIGVDPLIQPKLFEAFVMADGSSTRRYGGSGLGLTICRNLLDLMGGTIDLTSKGQNQGAIVRLCIPVVTNTVEPEKQETENA